MGISDTAGAALWALDTALEVAFTGTAGIHFHRERCGSPPHRTKLRADLGHLSRGRKLQEGIS
jgi:hypothetical protein